LRFSGKSVARPWNGAVTIAMAEDFAGVIYAIETNNQPRFGCN
jgi:hypothetical protein